MVRSRWIDRTSTRVAVMLRMTLPSAGGGCKRRSRVPGEDDARHCSRRRFGYVACVPIARTGDIMRSMMASASVSVFGQRSASLLQGYTLRPVTECNCVAVRRGGEQQEVNEQPVVIEPVSACPVGEPASQWRSPDSTMSFPLSRDRTSRRGPWR